MLINNSERELIHKYWIKGNERLCLDVLDGKCDNLGQNPNEYSETIKWASFYEFLYPLIICLIWIALTSRVVFSSLFVVFSAIFVPGFSLFMGSNFYVLIIVFVAGLVIELLYFGYLFKQIGIYAVIPLSAFVVQILLSLIPFVGVPFAAFFGLIPWSLLAVGTHYIHYQVGIGVMFNTEELCYINKPNVEFFNKW